MAVDEAASPVDLDSEELERLMRSLEGARAALASRIIGQESGIEEVLVGILAEGHVLLEGPPGVGKTLLVKSVAEVLGLEFSRIQFTPDLMPADITGSTVLGYDEAGKPLIRFEPGPIFAQLVLADEVNRATPKTQSALLEAMQEHTVTVASQTHVLPDPFVVLATQNPIEMEGTYKLPEAQIDRFLLKVTVPFPAKGVLDQILASHGPRLRPLERSLDTDSVRKLQGLVRTVAAASSVRSAIVELVYATQGDARDAGIAAYVHHGISPRGAQSLLAAAKARALLQGRLHVGMEDVARMMGPALRHRLMVNYEGQARGLTPDGVVEQLEGIVAKARA